MAYITNRRVYGGVGEWFFYWFDIICFSKKWRLGEKTGLEAIILELVSKELNHLAAILHVYAGGLNFMK